MKTILKTPEQARQTRHIEGVFFCCHDCGEIKPINTEGCATGYACLKKENALVCYPCADKREIEDLKSAERFFAYVSGNGRKLTTWTGGILGDVYFGARHPWSRERHYISATDIHGQRWHGTGAEGMYCNLRRCKK